jgi:hypothetical protein
MEEVAQESHDAEEAAVEEEVEESEEEPAEEESEEPESVEEEPIEEEESVTASGSDAWTSDRDETGKPKAPTASMKASLLRRR